MSTLPLRECRGHSKGVLKQTTMTYVKRILFAVATFAVFASPATAKDPKDRMWIALTSVQCGGVSVRAVMADLGRGQAGHWLPLQR
jgi:hypothetical protein